MISEHGSIAIRTVFDDTASALEHLVEGVTEGGADAVLAASIFHFGEHTVGEAKDAMAAAGIEVRRQGQ